MTCCARAGEHWIVVRWGGGGGGCSSGGGGGCAGGGNDNKNIIIVTMVIGLFNCIHRNTHHSKTSVHVSEAGTCLCCSSLMADRTLLWRR